MSIQPIMQSNKQSATRPARLLHLTDSHLFASEAGKLRGTNTLASLQAVIRHIRDSGWQADLVAVTGDIIQDDSRQAYERFRDCLAGLQLPVACIPGNHDIPELMRSVLISPAFTYCDTHALQDWLVIGIDSCVAGSAGGRVAAAEVARAREAIAESGKAHALVCLHHPPVQMGSRWLDSVGLQDGTALLNCLADIPQVRGTLSGHVHQDYAARHGGIDVIATPSTCRQFKPQSDLFAVDDRPPAYRRVELFDNGEIDSELVWVNG